MITPYILVPHLHMGSISFIFLFMYFSFNFCSIYLFELRSQDLHEIVFTFFIENQDLYWWYWILVIFLLCDFIFCFFVCKFYTFAGRNLQIRCSSQKIVKISTARQHLVKKMFWKKRSTFSAKKWMFLVKVEFGKRMFDNLVYLFLGEKLVVIFVYVVYYKVHYLSTSGDN